jgi:hypothetical protein
VIKNDENSFFFKLNKKKLMITKGQTVFSFNLDGRCIKKNHRCFVITRRTSDPRQGLN